MTPPKVAIASALLALVTFAGLTALALESGDVAIVETTAPDGSTRATHVWFAFEGSALWLEAGTPENPWYLDVLRTPELSFSVAGTSERYVAEPVPAEESRKRVRAMLHEKYGFRDSWVGLLVDSSKSVAVRLNHTR